MNECGDPVDTWHGHMRRRVRAQHDALLMDVAFFLEVAVSGRTIGMHNGAGFNNILDKRQHLAFRAIDNTAQPDASKSLGLDHLDCDSHQGFGGVGFASFGIDWLGLVTNGDEGFIDLHQPAEQIPARADHGPAKTVQHGPGRLIAAKTEDAVQSQGAHARFCRIKRFLSSYSVDFIEDFSVKIA